MHLSIKFLIVCTFFLVHPFQYYSFSQPLNHQPKETLLSDIPFSKMIGNTFSFSSDMSKIAFCIKNGTKQQTVINNVSGKVYDSVCMPVFSKDSKRFAYASCDNNNWLITIDGKTDLLIEPGYKVQSILFSPDSKSFVYIIHNNDQYFLIQNGIKTKPYQFIDENSVRFSTDSKKTAFTARDQDKYCIVFNGTATNFYEQVGYPIISKNGNRLVFWMVENGKKYVVADGKKSNPYDEIDNLQISPDDRHIAFNATIAGMHTIVYDGTESELYSAAHTLSFNKDCSIFAYGIETTQPDKEGFRQYVVINGKKIGAYETVVEESFRFSADGKNLAYEVEIHDEFFIVNNGAEGPRNGDVMQATTVFSPDNKRLAYVADNNSMRKVYEAGNESSLYNDIYFIAFSPDSKHIAYSVKLNGREFVVTDGLSGNKYDEIMGFGQVIFDTSDSLHYMALKDEKVYLVEQKL